MARFEDRAAAGRRLADRLAPHGDQVCHVVALRPGSVLVAAPIAHTLGAPLSLLFLGRLPIPWNPETGFGAVSASGDVLIDDKLVDSLSLSSSRVRSITVSVLREVKRRQEVFQDVNPPLQVSGRRVILVGEGLASGYTALAGISALRNKKPESVVVAAPCASQDAVQRISEKADEMAVLIVKATGSFQTASFYEQFAEPSDDAVRAALAEAN
ncbi:MAG: phosphoribosyltransferase family protein [Planctomycetota bacterium]